MSDVHDLARFLDAQATVYETALQELRQGKKVTHWMWFIFPQVAGLGHSALAHRYAIRSRAEAEAYLAHPVLGPRLRDCATALLAHPTRSAREILGAPDDMKLWSSATLFASVEGNGTFTDLLTRFFGGMRDGATLRVLCTNEPTA